MEDEELWKMFNPTLKRRDTFLFFLIVVINELTWIVSDIGLDTCARGRWRVEVSKMEMNQIELCISFLYINNIQKYYSVSLCVLFPLLLCLRSEERRVGKECGD